MGRVVLIVLLALAAGAGWLWYSINSPYKDFSSEGVFVDVPHGASSRGVARLLQKQGAVRNAMAFEFYARRHPRRSLQAGSIFLIRRLRRMTCFGNWRMGKFSSSRLPCVKARRCLILRGSWKLESSLARRNFCGRRRIRGWCGIWRRRRAR